MDEGNSETNYFEEPVEQIQERNEEKAMVKSGLALLEKMIAHFDERIEFYQSNLSIKSDVETNPEVHLRTVIANRIVAANLTEEREYLDSLKRAHDN